MVTTPSAAMLPPDAYYDAALRWFDGASSLALARALIDATTDERSLWLRFDGFGLADLLMSESDATERARIVAGVARAAGQQLFTGPLFAGSSIGVGARKADGSLSGWQDQAETAWKLPVTDTARAEGESADLALLSTCARMLGASQQTLSLAIEHLSTRKQFGRVLSSFQALQHASVDRHCDLVLSGALLAQCIEHWSDEALRQASLHALKDLLSQAGVAAAEHAVQMLGAMGFTHECDVGLYLRHVLTLAARHGSAARHRAAFASLNVGFLD